MLFLLMLAEFVLIFYAILKLSKNTVDYRETFIKTTIIFSVLVVVITETLSFASCFSKKELAVSWFFSLIATLIIILLVKTRVPLPNVRSINALSKTEKVLLLIMTVFFVVTLGNALIFLPTNWDSMTYHMSRVAYWAQNKTVNHYSTDDLRQLASGVFAEYLILNTYVLSNGDSLANCVQWFYYLASAVVVTGIAKRLGLNLKYQLFSAFLFVLSPLAIMQASSTQNDMVASFWTLAFVYTFLDFIKRGKLGWDRQTLLDVLSLALCLSLGLMTKSTSAMAIIPFLLYLLINRIKKKDRLVFLAVYAACALSVIFIVCSGYFYRNYKTFGNIFATNTAVNSIVISGTANPVLMTMNFLKNTLMEFDIPIKIGDTALVDHAANSLIDFLNKTLDIAPNEPSSSFGGIVFKLNTGVNNHDTSGNPIPFILALISVIAVIFHHKKLPRSVSLFVLTSICSFIIPACIIKWQPWITRLLLPSIGLLSASAVAVMFYLIKESARKIFMAATVVICVLLSIFPLLLNKAQPLAIGVITYPFADNVFRSLEKYIDHANIYNYASCIKNDRLFMHFWCNTSIYDDYMDIIAVVKDSNSKKIGLISRGDYVYPLFAYLKTSDVIIKNVMVVNESKVYEDDKYVPDCLLFLSHDTGDELSIIYNNFEYVRTEKTDSHSIFMIKDD